MKTIDVTALGELLVDFTQSGTSPRGNPVLEANPGGAPCNVLAMLRKLGRSCAFIGKVGQDFFGDMLAGTVQDLGIDIRGLRRDTHVPTTLAFVHTLAGGEREFSFYRSPGADVALTEAELDRDLLTGCRIFHFGSLSLTDEPARRATCRAVELARLAGAVISFDPNLRPPLWGSLSEAREQIAWGLGQCHVLKISDNELEFMTGCSDFDRGAALLRRAYPQIRLMTVTAGAGGSYAYWEGLRAYEPIFDIDGVIEKTGAGDTFCACVLSFVLERGLEGLDGEELSSMLRFANAAAGLVTTKKGALKVMPAREDIERLLR